jgi:hypothetical protein
MGANDDEKVSRRGLDGDPGTDPKISGRTSQKRDDECTISSFFDILSQTILNSRPRTKLGSAISKRPNTSRGKVISRPRKDRGVISP